MSQNESTLNPFQLLIFKTFASLKHSFKSNFFVVSHLKMHKSHDHVIKSFISYAQILCENALKLFNKKIHKYYFRIVIDVC